MKYTEKEKIWSLLYPEDDAAANDIIHKMSDDMKISLTCAKVIYNRGYRNVADARKFIGADINALEDPFLMRDMNAAVSADVERIYELIDQEKYDEARRKLAAVQKRTKGGTEETVNLESLINTMDAQIED